MTSIDKKRSVIELLESSDDEDDLLNDTRKIFNSSTKKKKTPDRSESSNATAAAIKPEPIGSSVPSPHPESAASSFLSPLPAESSSEPSSVLNNRTQLGYFMAPIVKAVEGNHDPLVAGQRLTVVLTSSQGIISLCHSTSFVKVGELPPNFASPIQSLARNYLEKLSVMCTVVRNMPRIPVLIRIEIDLKTIGPPTLSELIQIKSETHSTLNKFGWTEGIPPPIAYRASSSGTNSNGMSKAGATYHQDGEENKTTVKVASSMISESSKTDDVTIVDPGRLFDAQPLNVSSSRLSYTGSNLRRHILQDDEPEFDNDMDDDETPDAPTHQASVSQEDFDLPDVDTSEVEATVDVDKLDAMFEEIQKEQLKDLPPVEMPKHLASVMFYDYQKDGIRWLLQQEQNDNIPPWFRQLPNGKWRCEISKCSQNKYPSLIRGTVLADDMGLGKTLQTLALFLLNPPKGQRGYPYVRQGMGSEYKPRTTLIVAPVSVMSNWILQIKKHVNQSGKKKILTVVKYHGPNRRDKTSLVSFNQVDIMITSYHTLASEIKAYNTDKETDKSLTAITTSRRKKTQKSPSIFDLHFHRVVLDEAHIIRNAKTGFFKACQKIHADHRLCLTGTPFVNKPNDIQSLLHFLQVQPLCSKKAFDRAVTERIQQRNPAGLSTLRTTMACIALRRTKANVLSTIKLVSKTVEQRIVKFPIGSQHKVIHDVLYMTTRAAFIGFLNGKDVDGIKQNYMAFIELVLRVRQSCCHAGLVPEERVENAKGVRELLKQKPNKTIDPEQAERMLAALRGLEEEEKGGECAICLEELDSESLAILKECKHIFCRPCLQQNRTDLCPLCRGQYTEDDIMTKNEVEESVQASKDAMKSDASLSSRKLAVKYALTLGRSPKMQALLDEIAKMEHDEKGVIFSQWTSHLDLIEQEFRKEGHTYCRIDGTMSADARQDSMERFDSEGCDTLRTPRFILCSLMACGTGINLIRGNVVFLMDPWWNAAAENQAMDRVHRIGQTRPVRVVRFLMENSIETRMMALQDAKSALGKGSLQKLKPEEQRKARMMTLTQLLEAESVESLFEYTE